MGKRYGGRHSPNYSRSAEPQSRDNGSKAGPPAQRRRLNPAGARVNLLFMLPFLFAFRAFFRDPAGLATNLGIFALLMLAAWLTREGVIAQAAYDSRRTARRPAFPRKIFGAVTMGLGLGLAGATGAGGLLAGVILGALGAGLHFAAFGPDPLRDKGIEGIDQFQTDRVARAVEQAEQHLKAMSDAVDRCRDRRVTERLRKFQAHVRQLLRTIEDDPRHLSAARRYLGVYLLGARDAAVKFADLYTRNNDQAARDDFLTLLDDLQQNFALRTETLLDSDRQALDIEMAVLRERLEREGLRPDTPALDAPDDNTLSPMPSPEKGRSDV